MFFYKLDKYYCFFLIIHMFKLLFTALIFFSIFSYSQDFIFNSSDYDFDKYNYSKKNYTIYQYLENDSTNTKLVKTVKFDDRGLKFFESTNDYKTSKLTFVHDHITKFVYKQNLLVKTETTFSNSINKIYSTFKYNRKKYPISITSKKFEIGIRTKVEKTSEGELLGEEKWETKAKWKIDLKKYFKYDKLGRLIKTNIPEKFNMSQNIYHYYYYSKNNPIKITSFDRERLIWDEYREYHNENDYDYTRIWPDSDFKISEICRDVGKVSFKYDNQNKLAEISKPDYTGIRGNIKIKFYYSNEKQLQKVEIISVDNQVELTSLYKYD